MDFVKVYFSQTDQERNIYEPSELFEQCRKEVKYYFNDLASPCVTDGELKLEPGQIICKSTEKIFPINNQVIDFTSGEEKEKKWNTLNLQFQNYHKSLSLYTHINSLPVINYISLHSGFGFKKGLKVIDVGGGTGHTLCSFFQYPETLDYFLVDPNLRLLHDQYIRIYPKLFYLKIAHILAYAEGLPLKSNFADLVISIFALDHYLDYKRFISEAFRVLKSGGSLFIAGHLDIPQMPEDKTYLTQKLFTTSCWERLTRFLYYRRFKVGRDDHTFHFTTPAPIKEAMMEAGFQISKTELFKRYFYTIGIKP